MTLAVVTGASSGIGLELARLAAEDGSDLILAADDPALDAAADELRAAGATVATCLADLGTDEGLGRLLGLIGDRPVDELMANAGHGLGGAFLDQDEAAILSVIAINVTGTTLLVHGIAARMAARGAGRILITGSIAGLMPGSFQAVYNASKAYVDTLSWGIRNELGDSGVTVTCLMPGPTETEFFHRAGLDDTPVGQGPKDDPAKVARAGYAAMKRGASGVTPGLQNKVQAALSGLIPDSLLARIHRRMAEPEEAR